MAAGAQRRPGSMVDTFTEERFHRVEASDRDERTSNGSCFLPTLSADSDKSSPAPRVRIVNFPSRSVSPLLARVRRTISLDNRAPFVSVVSRFRRFRRPGSETSFTLAAPKSPRVIVRSGDLSRRPGGTSEAAECL